MREGGSFRDYVEPQDRIRNLPVVDAPQRAASPGAEKHLTIGIRFNGRSDGVVPAARGMSARASFTTTIPTRSKVSDQIPRWSSPITPIGDVAAPGAKERLGQGRWRRSWCRAVHDLTVASHGVAAVGGHGVPSAPAEDAVGTGSSYQAVVAAESIESVVPGTAVDEIRLRGSRRMFA